MDAEPSGETVEASNASEHATRGSADLRWAAGTAVNTTTQHLRVGFWEG